MKRVSNKSRKPISIPLPGGRTLYLGPGKTGEIAANAAEHPGVQALVAGGVVEIVEGGRGHGDATGPGGRARAARGGQGSGSRGRRSGDR